MPSEIEEYVRAYCGRYAGQIAVREIGADGKWGAFFLSELSAEKREKHVATFAAQGKTPHRVLTPEEVRERERRNPGWRQE